MSFLVVDLLSEIHEIHVLLGDVSFLAWARALLGQECREECGWRTSVAGHSGDVLLHVCHIAAHLCTTLLLSPSQSTVLRTCQLPIESTRVYEILPAESELACGRRA